MIYFEQGDPMVELRRTIRCSNCGTDTNFYLSSEMNLHELLIHGKCARCGNSLQINFNIVDSGKPAETQSAKTEEAQPVNLDESLFGESSELPSDAIKDLIGS